MKASFAGLSFTDAINSFSFANPSASLTLVTGTGTDVIVLSSLDPAFAAALLQYSNGALTGALTGNADSVVVALTEPSYDDASSST